MTNDISSDSYFWDLADSLLQTGAVTRSTMMGLPCLRLNGLFFASFDRRTDSLLVKLPAARVDELIDSDQGAPFAPAGRRFRQWAAITSGRSAIWPSLLDEALSFAIAQQPKGSKPES